MKEISLLLGAGFSVNQGYPTANRLNSRISSLDVEDFYIHSSGTVCLKKKETSDPNGYSSKARVKHFIVKLIQLFKSKGDFDYEEFYDFYNEIYRSNIENREFEMLCDSFREEFHDDTDNHNLLHQTNHVFNQLISLLLVDKNNQTFYAPAHFCKPIFPGYTGFLNCIEKWGENATVHIHTLNHDIFFEVFKNSDWLKGNLSDGFVELGSPYYGNLGERYNVRLPFFTNEYEGNFRLYKLHGSLDQLPFHLPGKGIDAYIKIKAGIGFLDLYKEVVDEAGKLCYINDWINYHPDFLSGTTSKILRYKEPLYYEKVFSHFETNLFNSEKLILIGYGCGDSEINNIIFKRFDFNRKKLFIVDPYPSEKINLFIKRTCSTLINKDPANLFLEDFL